MLVGCRGQLGEIMNLGRWCHVILSHSDGTLTASHNAKGTGRSPLSLPRIMCGSLIKCGLLFSFKGRDKCVRRVTEMASIDLEVLTPKRMI